MRVRASILVQRPIEVVFACLSTPDELPRWIDSQAWAHGGLPDDNQVGATLAFECSAPAGRLRSKWEVTAYEPPRSLALRGLDQGCGGVELRWTLERVPSGATCVWVEADLTPSGLFQPSATDLADRGRRQVQHDLEILSRRLESQNLRRPMAWLGGWLLAEELDCHSTRAYRTGSLPNWSSASLVRVHAGGRGGARSSTCANRCRVGRRPYTLADR